ncbi:Dam family site-specific DNA-(adenine-N6)-methyltransferase [Candidatus Bathyarchaeota archaeon]|nr:Dam family site-specific DNA-(adenine-N6)-methyltransferase [Candidatus Bathyarchaeota archaeon]
MRPLLKWAGGKRSQVKRIVGLFPGDIRERGYHEPFFGGGAVFFHVEPNSGSINDINPKLMNFYRVVRDDPEALIEEASKYRYEEAEYYELRTRYNSPGLSEVEYAAILLYLNKTAYNGLYRVNSKGEFNVPFGRHVDPTIVKPRSIMRSSRLLGDVEIRCGSYDYVLDAAEEGSLCYMDPPYHPASETANFTDYSTNGFKVGDQERLRDLCLELNKRGVNFVLSNSYTEKVMEFYGGHGFRIESLKTRRSISSKVSSRDSGYDLLITNNV